MNKDRFLTWVKAMFGVNEQSKGKTDSKRAKLPRAESSQPIARKDPPEKVVDPPRRLGNTSSLRSRLQRELDKGVALEQRAQNALAIVGASVFSGPLTTQVDVDAWEARVEHILREHPRLLSLFRYNEPRSGMPGLLTNPLENPLRKRLNRRNIQLEKIIRDL